MASLTNVINLSKTLVKDQHRKQKMMVPLDYPMNALLERLGHCVHPTKFERFHKRLLIWIQEVTRNDILEKLCHDVALNLSEAIGKVWLIRNFMSQRIQRPYFWHSDRHAVVSALQSIFQVFTTFLAVKSKPPLDQNAVVIRAVLQKYLEQTFHHFFLLAELVCSREQRDYFRSWKSYLAFDDFKFDGGELYSSPDREVHLESPIVHDSIIEPASTPGTCLLGHHQDILEEPKDFDYLINLLTPSDDSEWLGGEHAIPVDDDYHTEVPSSQDKARQPQIPNLHYAY